MRPNGPRCAWFHIRRESRSRARALPRTKQISGIVHVLIGRRLYGPRKTLYNRYVRWAGKGVWGEPLPSTRACRRPQDQTARRTASRFSTQLLIDSSAVKAHRSAFGGNVGPAPSASGFCALI